MVSKPAEVWLAEEVRNHLTDFGQIGLYELIWLLNGSDFELSKEDSLAVAKQVAEQAIRDWAVEVYLVRWPDADIVEGPMVWREVLENKETWEVEENGDLLFALMPVN